MAGQPVFQHFSHIPASHSDASTSEAWHNYTCGHCGVNVNGKVLVRVSTPDCNIKWLICTNCSDGSVLTKDNTLLPNVRFGPGIQGLPNEIASAYDEARDCYSIKAYTACEIMCRKILMHVGVDKGCAEGKSFVDYIDFIESKNYITPVMKPWVNLIRKHGNSSTHKLVPADPARSESTLMFTAELLKIVYEMDYIARKYAAPPN
jgi:hypothetical protein